MTQRASNLNIITFNRLIKETNSNQNFKEINKKCYYNSLLWNFDI